ncbi:MAG: hypothetical protein A4E47_00829 [Methanosaeta sp. PtaU1.Bin028]|nr:MAG: hypothetical protein A4E47_00829 [Methanosaeta sp. PtaU1.Bin028]
MGRYAHLHLELLQIAPQSSQILTHQAGGLAYTNHHGVVVHGHLGGNAHTDCQTAYGQGGWVQGSSEDIGIPSSWSKGVRQVTSQHVFEATAHRRSGPIDIPLHAGQAGLHAVISEISTNFYSANFHNQLS